MLHENKEQIEYVILVAADVESGGLSSYNADASLDELAELADTAGAVVVGMMHGGTPEAGGVAEQT